jgi:hypothetical protein
MFMISPERAPSSLSGWRPPSPDVAWRSGVYGEKGKPAKGANPPHDADLARQLWERSEELPADRVV